MWRISADHPHDRCPATESISGPLGGHSFAWKAACNDAEKFLLSKGFKFLNLAAPKQVVLYWGYFRKQV